MRKLPPEPDDVEFIIGDVEPEATASVDTARYIEEYKKRPEYRYEAEEAERILAELGIRAPDYGMLDAKALLDPWHRCVADLTESESGEANNGQGADADRDANPARSRDEAK